MLLSFNMLYLRCKDKHSNNIDLVKGLRLALCRAP